MSQSVSQYVARSVRAGLAGLVGAAAIVTGLSFGSAAAHSAPAQIDDNALCNVDALDPAEALKDSDTVLGVAQKRMHVREAHAITKGAGVSVAVIDSGVSGAVGINLEAPIPTGFAPALLSGHGTIAAGLIAGPDGVAPQARVIDVRVLDKEGADTSQGEKPVTSASIAAGIRALLSSGRKVDVVSISLAVPQSDPVLEAAIADLIKRDIVVVASSGNVDPGGQEDNFKGTPGSDAEVFPADYPGVIAVSAVGPDNDDPRSFVLPNKDTDVAAPTYGAISINANGQRCDIGEVATSWSTAQVAGVVALLRARFPKENADQIAARLFVTTEGSSGDEYNVWIGHGVVQAHDALTRELDPEPSGAIKMSAPAVRADSQAPPPPPQFDLFGSARALMLWSALAGGALIALAAMLRPVLRRRD